ncbi:MAG: nucleoside kinase [Bacilli bacterium]
MGFNVKITNGGKEKTVHSNKIALIDLLDNNDEKKYFAANVNNRLRELTYELHYDATVQFLDLQDGDAVGVYERSLRYLFCMAMYHLYPTIKFRMSYNISRSILIESLEDIKVSEEMMKKIESEMKEIVKADYEFTRKIVTNAEAVEVYTKYGYTDKTDILMYRPEATVHFYKCDDYLNYMYGMMVPSTGYLKSFKLSLHSEGIIMQYPRSEENGKIPPFTDAPVYGKTLKESYRWGKLIGANSVAGINNFIKQYGITAFVNICETRQNHMLNDIGNAVESNIDELRLICIAGPSSSGKTTFANRLRIELLARGIKSIRVSIDDYYLIKSEIPCGDDGKPDLEHIHALDIPQFNEDLLKLIQGEEVTLPHFNFKKGVREVGVTHKLDKDEIIIIEGIHALNEELTSSISKTQKYKIYIAPQAQIYLDNQNPMSLTDLRLLRRMVRDYKFRNAAPEETFSMWGSVRKGEFKWIYDTQENADYVYNSFLQYELCIIKKYAVPLLTNISKESPYFPDAERLLRMLKYFVDIDDVAVPNNSLIREFIGGSVYQDED